MGTTEQFSRADLLRILNVSEKQLGQWEKMEFVPSLHPGIKDHYDFRDLIKRIRAGDPDAAVQLVREYEPEIRRAIRAARKSKPEGRP